MQDFFGPIDFERTLIDSTSSVLSGSLAEVRHNQRIGNGIDSWELDLVLFPHTPTAEGKIYIFEFKFSHSPTLPDSQLFTQFARFSALKEANRLHRLMFILVTNGRARPYAPVPENVSIIDEVSNEDVWHSKFRSWLHYEIPDLGVRSNYLRPRF